MTVRSFDLKTVQLVPHLLWMEERVDMTLYTITEWSLVHRNTSNLSKGIKMMLTMQRKLMNEMSIEIKELEIVNLGLRIKVKKVVK